MKLTEQDLLTLSKNESIYKQALQLSKSGAVQSFTYNRSLNAYYAVVYDRQIKHEIMIYLNKEMKLHRFQCGCLYHRQTKQPCVHIIACLKAILDAEKEDKISLLSNQIAAQNVLNMKEWHESSETKKTKLKVDLIINSDEIQRNPLNQYYLQFKIGLEKKYVVKDVLDLIDAIDKNEDLIYGKDFTFLCELHTFSKPFLKTLDYFRKLKKIDSYANVHFFEGKKVYLTNEQLKEILHLWMNQKIQFLDRFVEVTDDAFPDYIDLFYQGGSIIADVSGLKHVISIYEDSSVLIDNEMLYIIDSKLASIYHPFIEANRMGLTKIVFEGENRTSFIENAIENIEKIKTIPESIQNLYVHGRLKAKIYLDKMDTHISCTPEFTYNNYSFNPFSKVNIPYDHGRLVLRNWKREQKIMKILEKSEFLVAKNNLYLDDDEKIRTFIFEYLPHLQQYAEVLFSDSFKQIIKKRTLSTHVSLNNQINLFEIDFDLKDISYLEFKKILESYHLKHHYHRLKDGSFLSLDDPNTIEALQMAEDLNITKNHFKNGQILLPFNRAFYLGNHFKDDLNHDQAFQEFMKQFETNLIDEITLPTNINAKLRDYQVVGYKWLKTLGTFHLGGILADDMGLGKTLQTITYIQDFQNNKKGIHLIICPTSLVFNWLEEIKRFAPNLKTLVVYGTQQDRANKISTAQEYDIILTSYPLLRRDIDLYEEIQFDTCVLDEAQYIKNRQSLNANATKRIKASVRFALTGTPIENNLAELWSIFDFILPDFFSNYHYYRNKYEVPIIKDFDMNTANLLKKQIEPFILRRMKKDVLKELPDKIETKISVKMTPKQEEIYMAYLLESKRMIESDIKSYGLGKTRFEILSRLTHLRQLCNHPSLFIDNYDGQSAKLNTLLELIREAVDGKHRILIFSQFTAMLKIVSEELDHQQIPYYYLDGNTKLEDRAHYVRSFNKGNRQVFLISLKAGGTGLNLTGADMVIHVDPWWNPAVENQATDRAYRIGQKNTVQVIKLITAKSIEEKIFEMQEAKKNLIDSVIESQESFITQLTDNEIYDLFTIDK